MQFIKDRWVLFVVLVVFIIFKFPHLHYPFFWDESWPYATAVQHMYDHGISLMPNAIDAELSRGHPLFFHAAAATWMKIFGRSNFALHSFALFIAVLFLIIIYEAGLRLFNKRAAVIALLLVALQVVFFVQSSFLLFDMLVAFLSFTAIYLYVQRMYLATAIILTALFYTKESGLMAGFIIGIDALVSFFNKKELIKERIYKILAIGIPVVLIGIFFLIQKSIRGWYVFPLYSGLIENDWGAFWYRFRMGCVRFSFYEDYRYLFFAILFLLSCIAAIKNRSARYLIVFIPGALVCLWVRDAWASHIPSRPAFMLFLIAVIYAVFQFKKLNFFKDIKAYKFILLLSFYMLCFLCFSAMNFFTYRYLLADIVPALFIAGMYIEGLIQRTYKLFIYPVAAVILFSGYFAFSHDKGLGDCDLEAFHCMNVYSGIINYMEEHDTNNKVISAANFQHREHLTDPYTGYLHTGKIFSHVQWEIDSTTDYALFDNIEPDTRYDTVKRNPAFYRIYRIEQGTAWGEIYQRKK